MNTIIEQIDKMNIKTFHYQNKAQIEHRGKTLHLAIDNDKTTISTHQTTTTINTSDTIPYVKQFFQIP